MAFYLRFYGCLLLMLSCMTGCVFMPGKSIDTTANERPAAFESYYQYETYTAYTRQVQWRRGGYTVERIRLESPHGPVTIDYFRRPNPSENIILVFPILGGRNTFANYFAGYFAERVAETAVIHRDGAFKDPENFFRMEELFRTNILKDRVALDYFEQEHGKRRFGSFGISRGAINVALTAGVDKRLQYNVLAMGGQDLVRLFRDSAQKGVDKFQRRVMERHGISEEEFFNFLRENVRSEPRHVASYINANDTLMILAAFDRSVPFKYGLKLRRTIGEPDTIYLAAGHYTSLLYTRYAPIIPPALPVGIFPLDYIESEATGFYDQKFGTVSAWRHLPFRVLQLPFSIIGSIVQELLD